MGEGFAPGRCSYRAGSVADGSRAEAPRRRGGEKEWVSASRSANARPGPDPSRMVLAQRRRGAEVKKQKSGARKQVTAESFAPSRCPSRAGSIAEGSRAEARRRRGEKAESQETGNRRQQRASRFSIVPHMPGPWRWVLPQRRGGAEVERQRVRKQGTGDSRELRTAQAQPHRPHAFQHFSFSDFQLIF